MVTIHIPSVHVMRVVELVTTTFTKKKNDYGTMAPGIDEYAQYVTD